MCVCKCGGEAGGWGEGRGCRIGPFDLYLKARRSKTIVLVVSEKKKKKKKKKTTAKKLEDLNRRQLK